MNEHVPMSDDPGEEYELVMPFVVVASKGGPYDDDAYCAGYEMGRLDADLDVEMIGLGTITETRTVRTANAAQADLVAMMHGWRTVKRTDHEDGEWTTLRFERSNVEMAP